MEWPTSSKLSVASLPACSSKTSSPPGCWKRRLKVSKSMSAKEVSRVSAAFLALFIPYEWNQHQRYLPKIQSSSLSFRKSQRTMHAAQLGNTLHKIKIFSKRQVSNVHRETQLIPLQQNQPFCNSATDLGKKIIQKKAYPHVPLHCPHCTNQTPLQRSLCCIIFSEELSRDNSSPSEAQDNAASTGTSGGNDVLLLQIWQKTNSLCVWLYSEKWRRTKGKSSDIRSCSSSIAAPVLIQHTATQHRVEKEKYCLRKSTIWHHILISEIQELQLQKHHMHRTPPAALALLVVADGHSETSSTDWKIPSAVLFALMGWALNTVSTRIPGTDWQ